MKKIKFLLLISILLVSLTSCSNQNSNYNENNYTTNNSYSSNKYSTSSSTSSYKKKALTKEEADALRGTGYHNTRPNSTAENIELKAAQVKCKECGYHSDNGANSLCDDCQSKKK